MKQKVTKRLIAWIFAFCVVFSLTPGMAALANPADEGKYLTFTSTGESFVTISYS